MGEQTELILDGVVCEGCGEFLEAEAPGYPRRCPGCETEEQTFDKEWNEFEKKSKAGRRKAAAHLYQEARDLAEEHGLRLVCHTETHYQLMPRDRSWIMNVYPGNRRLYYDRQKQKPPFLRVPQNWDLRDVVIAAIRETN